jgi:hypothetical protein
MRIKVIAIGIICLVLGAVGGAHVLAQTSQPNGNWQLVVSNGGDGGSAGKFNADRRIIL